MEKLKLAHSKQVEEFSTDVQKVLKLTEIQTLNDTVASFISFVETTNATCSATNATITTNFITATT